MVNCIDGKVLFRMKTQESLSNSGQAQFSSKKKNAQKISQVKKTALTQAFHVDFCALNIHVVRLHFASVFLIAFSLCTS